jgi:cyclopropane fatty-acyl-phospholipid synthase-like methyltransferase
MFLQRLFYRLWHGWTARRRRRFWDKAWSKGWFAPAFQRGSLRDQLSAALEAGAFPPGASVLDIGCGHGAGAAWLAEKGFKVTAVDISPAAIERSAKMYAAVPGLEFRVVDACEPGALDGQFDVLLDSACFHALSRGQLPHYAGNLKRWSRPGTRLMILSLLIEPSFEKMIETVRGLMSPEFEIASSAPTTITHPGGANLTGAGAEIHLVRK